MCVSAARLIARRSIASVLTTKDEVMACKVILALTVLVFLTTGRAPGMRELRNPDAEAGQGRIVHTVKRQAA
ncbi:MAG TPA: hypothetical protein VF641_04495 [Methylobacterium sp.]|jgi:hypothetical protein